MTSVCEECGLAMTSPVEAVNHYTRDSRHSTPCERRQARRAAFANRKEP